MSYVVSIALAVASWLRGMPGRHAKVSLAAATLWVWMWLLTWANSGSPDAAAYRYFYYSDFTTDGIGPGYWFLVSIARDAGLEYGVFLAITAGAAFGLMAFTAGWFTSNSSLVALLYFVYPFVFDAIQARNLMAMALVILGFALRVRLRKFGVFAFLVLILLAATIHVTMLVYIVALPVLGDLGGMLARWLAPVGILGATFAAIQPDLVRALGGVIVDRLEATRLEAYFVTDARVGVFLFLALHLATLVVLAHTDSVVHRFGSELGDPRERLQPSAALFVRLVYRSALALTVFLPLNALNSNFWRPFRNMWFLYVIAFTIGLTVERLNGRKRSLWWAVLFLTAAHCIVQVPQFDHVVRPILENNWVLDQLYVVLEFPVRR